jgi:putative membrane protein
MTSSPWAWQLHALAWVTIVALGTAYAVALNRLGPEHCWPAAPASRRQRLSFLAGLVALAVALTWPLADLAANWSLLAHMLQLVVLTLVAPPLLLLGIPRWLVDVVTRPAAIDWTLRTLTRPLTATIVFNAAVITSLLPPVVAAGGSNPAVAGAVNFCLVCAGLVMWIPALRALPGPNQLSTPGRMAYLFAQSLLPNFPALIFIFASHPIYPELTAHAHVFGISALADQQLAGAAAKVTGISVLWGTAAAILVRAQRAEEEGRDPDPLKWDDVDRELRRLERRPRRTDAS